MRTLLRGSIEDLVPFFWSRLESGMLVLGDDGTIPLTVDTGFNGGIALKPEVIEKLEKELVGRVVYTLATGDSVELPVYSFKVVIAKKEIQTSLIPGDSLIGMEFLSSVGSMLSLNLRKNTIRLSK